MKNIVSARRKQMVEVTALHLVDGKTAPLAVRLKDGRSFDVETYSDPVNVSNHTALHRYSVQIKGHSTSLYEEKGRWWVLMKE